MQMSLESPRQRARYAMPAGPRDDRRRTLLREIVRVPFYHPVLMVSSILPNAIEPAIAPIQAWIAREVLDRVAKGESTFTLRDLLPYVATAVACYGGLACLYLFNRVTNVILDGRVRIDLQRTWFARRPPGDAGAQVAQAFNDCAQAHIFLEMFQSEIWRVVIGLPAVLIWQVTLGPEWLTALLVAALPPFLFAATFGGRLQHNSEHMLRRLSGMGAAVAANRKRDLYLHQERWYRHSIRFECFKVPSTMGPEVTMWIGVLLVVALTWGDVWALVPESVTAGQVGVFLVNLRLLTVPLVELSKLYMRVRANWPGVVRVLRPK
jgi:hypothetical protein